MKDKGNTKNLVIFDHHIVRNSQICGLNKFTNRELYLILVHANTVKPTTQDYFENLFETSQFNWKNIYYNNIGNIRNIRNTTLDTKVRQL